MGRPMAGMALEELQQLGRRRDEERQDQAVGLREVERPLDQVLRLTPVTHPVVGGGRDDERLDHGPDAKDRHLAGEDVVEGLDGVRRRAVRDPQRGDGEPGLGMAPVIVVERGERRPRRVRVPAAQLEEGDELVHGSGQDVPRGQDPLESPGREVRVDRLGDRPSRRADRPTRTGRTARPRVRSRPGAAAPLARVAARVLEAALGGVHRGERRRARSPATGSAVQPCASAIRGLPRPGSGRREGAGRDDQRQVGQTADLDERPLELACQGEASLEVLFGVGQAGRTRAPRPRGS